MASLTFPQRLPILGISRRFRYQRSEGIGLLLEEGLQHLQALKTVLADGDQLRMKSLERLELAQVGHCLRAGKASQRILWKDAAVGIDGLSVSFASWRPRQGC